MIPIGILSPFLGPFESHHPVIRVVSRLIVDLVNPARVPLEGVHLIECNAGLEDIDEGKSLEANPLLDQIGKV